MAKILRRACISLPEGVERELEQLKKRYYNESESTLLGMVIRKGMEACRGRDGQIYLESDKEILQSDYMSFPVPVELPTDAMAAPFGRFYVCSEEGCFDGGVRKVSINKVVSEESEWITGYLTSENVVYFVHEGEWLRFRLDGRIVRGKQPICEQGKVYIPVNIKGKRPAYVKDYSVCASSDPHRGYFFNCTEECLCLMENGLFKPLASAEKGV